MWFSIEVAYIAALSEAMSKKFKVRSTKNKLEYTKQKLLLKEE